MNVGFFPNLTKPNIIEVLKSAKLACEKYGITVYFPNDTENPDLHKEIKIDKEHYLTTNEVINNIDIAFSFGGDGTILDLTRKIIPRQIPICGINLGDLGFLNQIELNNIDHRMKEISEGNYLVEDRSYFQATIQKENGINIKLAPIMNDLVVTHPLPGKMARIILSINHGETQTYPCDGIIVATSTGSTGYNLSAGGPIMAPDNHSMIITPLAPHLLQSVTLILQEYSHIKITMPEREPILHISVDGTYDYSFTNKENLEIQSGKEHFKFIRFHDNPFFTTLFPKLMGKTIVK